MPPPPVRPTSTASTPAGQVEARGKSSRILGAMGLVAWGGLMVVLVATLMVGHWVALPSPSEADRPKVAEALATLRSAADEGRWLAVHAMYVECKCSQRIVDHLTKSARPEGVAEHVLLVGEDPDMTARLAARGFSTTQLAPEELAGRFHIQAAPLLLVAAPDGSLRYLGGYTERKQGYDIRDIAILNRLRAQAETAELPAFGCAVSRALQTLLDPLGVKYSTGTQRP